MPPKVPRLPQTAIRLCGKSLSQPDYRLDVGQHLGKTLDEVPASWLLWASDKRFYQQQLDLGIALLGLGRTATLEHDGEILIAEPHSRAAAGQAPDPSSVIAMGSSGQGSRYRVSLLGLEIRGSCMDSCSRCYQLVLG